MNFAKRFDEEIKSEVRDIEETLKLPHFFVWGMAMTEEPEEARRKENISRDEALVSLNGVGMGVGAIFLLISHVFSQLIYQSYLRISKNPISGTDRTREMFYAEVALLAQSLQTEFTCSTAVEEGTAEAPYRSGP